MASALQCLRFVLPEGATSVGMLYRSPAERSSSSMRKFVSSSKCRRWTSKSLCTENEKSKERQKRGEKLVECQWLKVKVVIRYAETGSTGVTVGSFV